MIEVTAREAAELFGVNIRTFSDWIQNTEPVRRKGRAKYFSLADIIPIALAKKKPERESSPIDGMPGNDALRGEIKKSLYATVMSGDGVASVSAARELNRMIDAEQIPDDIDEVVTIQFGMID